MNLIFAIASYDILALCYPHLGERVRDEDMAVECKKVEFCLRIVTRTHAERERESPRVELRNHYSGHIVMLIRIQRLLTNQSTYQAYNII